MNARPAGGLVDRLWLAQDLVWMLGSLCQFNRIPFDQALVAQQHPPPHSEATFIEAATALGFTVGRCDTSEHKLSELTFPFVALLRNPDAVTTISGTYAAPETIARSSADAAAIAVSEKESTTPAASLALVVKTDDHCLLYFRAHSNAGETVPVAEFTQRFEPVVLLVIQQANSKAPDDDLWSRDPQKFGFRWFVPELLKHKTIWRDVMLASFVLQLVGLTTPLFTQVIIDKVVVHQTQSTLIAIAVGLSMFLVFNAFLTWLRQYFILHTGNRIDAVLGSQVFRHLIRLHLRSGSANLNRAISGNSGHYAGPEYGLARRSILWLRRRHQAGAHGAPTTHRSRPA